MGLRARRQWAESPIGRAEWRVERRYFESICDLRRILAASSNSATDPAPKDQRTGTQELDPASLTSSPSEALMHPAAQVLRVCTDCAPLPAMIAHVRVFMPRRGTWLVHTSPAHDPVSVVEIVARLRTTEEEDYLYLWKAAHETT